MSGLIAGGNEVFRGFEVSTRVCRFVKTKRRVFAGGKVEGGCRRKAIRRGRVCFSEWWNDEM
jgi:hypothetical protein